MNDKKSNRVSKQKPGFLRLLASVLGWILAAIVIIVLCLPVILSGITTAIPGWACILLAVLDVAMIILLFRLKPAQKGIPVSLAGLLVVSILAVIASQAFAATPPILGDNGEPVPNSIAALEKVTLNGSAQWITIRGHDINKPNLLHLGMGGPGGGGFATRSLFEPLEKDFVVVSWDEPGTGKSYNAAPISDLTPQRFIDDAHELTLYLRQRFKQEKIYVYGVSWTSILGIWLVQQYPDLYYAYIGNGQMVNTTQNDIMGYEFALKYLQEKGDTKTLETLQRNGPPPYTSADMLGKYVGYLDVLNDYMNSPRYTLIVPIVPFIAPEYGYIDKINHTRGLVDSFQAVYPQLAELDFAVQATKLEVPVYFFVGRDDVNAMSSLVEDYFAILKAPKKELIWLEGGHGLSGENIGQFTDVMINKVLAETYPGQ